MNILVTKLSMLGTIPIALLHPDNPALVCEAPIEVVETYALSGWLIALIVGTLVGLIIYGLYKLDKHHKKVSVIGQAAMLSVTTYPEKWKRYHNGWRNDKFVLSCHDDGYDRLSNFKINNFDVKEYEYMCIINILVRQKELDDQQFRDKVSQDLLRDAFKEAAEKLKQLGNNKEYKW